MLDPSSLNQKGCLCTPVRSGLLGDLAERVGHDVVRVDGQVVRVAQFPSQRFNSVVSGYSVRMNLITVAYATAIAFFVTGTIVNLTILF
jgi:hypothetical protein